MGFRDFIGSGKKKTKKKEDSNKNSIINIFNPKAKKGNSKKKY